VPSTRFFCFADQALGPWNTYSSINLMWYIVMIFSALNSALNIPETNLSLPVKCIVLSEGFFKEEFYTISQKTQMILHLLHKEILRTSVVAITD
jgi:hypothetical protein